MPRTWTKTEAFAHFGAELENVRWSWSGVSPDGGVVALVLWQDGIKGRNGELTYADEDDLEAEWRSRPGHHARTRNLKHSVDQLTAAFARSSPERSIPTRIHAALHPVIRRKKPSGRLTDSTRKPGHSLPMLSGAVE